MKLSDIGRFGSSSSSSNNKSGGSSMPSMPAMPSMPSMKLGSVTTKLSAMKNLGANLHISNLTGEQDKKLREAELKKLQVANALAVLEEVRLQCPTSHTGLILAYSNHTLSPVINQGLKFTWFRMSRDDHLEAVEESIRSWYAPTVDDIGCVICAQCQDNFDQGCSRYLECGPLKADSLLCSLAESAVDNGSFEAKGVCVSLGVKEQNSLGKIDSPSDPDLSYDGGLHGEVSINHHHEVSSPTTTVLAKNSAFLQLDGRCSIEIDEQGLFISIPTYRPVVVPTDQQQSHWSDLILGKSKNTNTSTVSNSGSAGNLAGKKEFKTFRRGMRIPASTEIRVNCAQPTSLVLVVPITRKGGDVKPETKDKTPKKDKKSKKILKQNSNDSLKEDNKNDKTDNKKDNENSSVESDNGSEEIVDDEKMQKFLSSSIVSIPWTYEGHNHSPETYIAENESKLTTEEKQKLLQEAEEDSIIFANTIVALAEFISTLPEGTDEMRICFTCSDRLMRDALVLSIRSLVCQPSDTTRLERKSQVFPWLLNIDEEEEEGNDLDDSVLIADSQESIIETKKRLRVLEDENVNLKRERNELTNQLLAAREEVVLIKTKGPQQLSAEEEEGKEKNEEGFDKDLSINSSEEMKNLSRKVIELENKISISLKREAENDKSRADLESKNTKLTAENEKIQKLLDETQSRSSALQGLYDRQQQTVISLEKDQEDKQREIESLIEKLKEMDSLNSTLTLKEKQINELKSQLETANSDGENYRKMIDYQTNQISQINEEKIKSLAEETEKNENLQNQIQLFMEEIKKRDEEIEKVNKLLENQQDKISKTEKLQEKLSESEAEVNKLAGELKQQQRRSESQGRDLKKMMKENATTLAEFEKALIRKSEENNELYYKIQALEAREAEIMAQQQRKISSKAGRLLSSVGSVRTSSINFGRRRSNSNASVSTIGTTAADNLGDDEIENSQTNDDPGFSSL